MQYVRVKLTSAGMHHDERLEGRGSMEKPVLFEVENGIALITLNRPEKHNALNQDLFAHLYDAIEVVAGNPDIRVAIITGRGKSFCSGIDKTEIRAGGIFNATRYGRDFPDVISACRKPIIGAINGAAITGGLEIALNCDFLIASERAAFADTHTRVQIHPGWGMTQLLQQAVGQRMAKQMSFTGQFLSAEYALRCGLVNEVVPHEELIPRAKQIAADICAGGQEIVTIIKDLIELQNGIPLNEAFAREREGFKSFLKKHKLD